MANSPEQLLYEQGDIASGNGNRLDVAANDVPVGNRNDVRYPVAAVNHSTSHCTSFLLHVHSNLSTRLEDLIVDCSTVVLQKVHIKLRLSAILQAVQASIPPAEHAQVRHAVTLLDLEVEAKPAYKAKTAWTPMYSPGTLNVSNIISAVYSLFSGVFSGGSVKMKL